jgi:GxxExxY protein
VEINVLTGLIVDSAVEVQRRLGGPGLLESLYEEALACELELRGCLVRRQQSVPVYYKGRELMSPLRLDLIVNDSVVVECKSATKFNPLFVAQALTYLRLCRKPIALVINFGQRPLRPGIRRIVNDFSGDDLRNRRDGPRDALS